MRKLTRDEKISIYSALVEHCVNMRQIVLDFEGLDVSEFFYYTRISNVRVYAMCSVTTNMIRDAIGYGFPPDTSIYLPELFKHKPANVHMYSYWWDINTVEGWDMRYDAAYEALQSVI